MYSHFQQVPQQNLTQYMQGHTKKKNEFLKLRYHTRKGNLPYLAFGCAEVLFIVLHLRQQSCILSKFARIAESYPQRRCSNILSKNQFVYVRLGDSIVVTGQLTIFLLVLVFLRDCFCEVLVARLLDPGDSLNTDSLACCCSVFTIADGTSQALEIDQEYRRQFVYAPLYEVYLNVVSFQLFTYIRVEILVSYSIISFSGYPS